MVFTHREILRINPGSVVISDFVQRVLLVGFVFGGGLNSKRRGHAALHLIRILRLEINVSVYAA